MDAIERFIQKYNNYLELKKQVFDNVVLIKSRTNKKPSTGLIDKLYNNYTFPKEYNFSSFYFLDKQQKIKRHLIHFATLVDYNLFYVLNTKDNSIYLIDEETKHIEWYCAENPENFFLSMYIVLDVKMKYIANNYQDLNEQYLKDKLNECLSINGNKEDYSPFYSHVLCVH